MYDVSPFSDATPAQVLAFIRQHPFAVLAGADAQGRPVATQVPLLVDEDANQLLLRGHIMRKTDHHLAFMQNPQVLALFTGPHAYVSASWYSNPRQASTWNYMSVQAAGTLRFLDADVLHALLQRTTNYFEGNAASPARFERLDAAYVQQHMQAIVAFEIEVQTLRHTFKLSQNRDAESYHSIIHHLQQQGGPTAEVATAMQQRLNKS
ncbi:MAG: FMN-binding negative transcriptional regulator [Lacibacter sp.]|jgi:transcriptional regulator